MTIADTAGVSHTVEVTAGTLYEAVAFGLTALRSHDWAAELVYGQITVSVQNISVEHSVRISDFYQWLERHGGSRLR